MICGAALSMCNKQKLLYFIRDQISYVLCAQLSRNACTSKWLFDISICGRSNLNGHCPFPTNSYVQCNIRPQENQKLLIHINQIAGGTWDWMLALVAHYITNVSM